VRIAVAQVIWSSPAGTLAPRPPPRARHGSYRRQWLPAGPADTASGPAASVAPGRITRERTFRGQRLLVGRRAYLMDPGGDDDQGRGDVGSGCRTHRTTGSTLGCAAPNGDPESGSSAVLRHELAGGEGRASRIGKDGESHPRRILRLGEDRAPNLARPRSDRVHVVDGSGWVHFKIPCWPGAARAGGPPTWMSLCRHPAAGPGPTRFSRGLRRVPVIVWVGTGSAHRRASHAGGAEAGAGCGALVVSNSWCR
jgi:hypothetical protein